MQYFWKEKKVANSFPNRLLNLILPLNCLY
uniref:Uncharacterized protein n=1 Tax=Arundo donax TaxID=35708 RepID=A0A0A8YJH0_ARUDO